ncbi:MAG TPA: hypothetical protein VLF40_05490 [Candidatus Saccharimonadales bacterium]|nr:hypothetical protein [Candidatus Saccharimonadales bacterium]
MPHITNPEAFGGPSNEISLVPGLPPEITTPYPCIAIGDLYEVAHSLGTDVAQAEVDAFELRLDTLRRVIAPVDNATFYYTSAGGLSAPLEALAGQETARADRAVDVIHLDKYIGQGSENSAFFRLNVSRDSDDKLVSRVDTAATVDEQLAALADWAKTGAYQELVLVDDVLAFGSTIPQLVEKLRQDLPGVDFRLLVGLAATGGEWRGIENIQEKTGIQPENLVKIHASPAVPNSTKGMSIPVSRDMTIFGGKAGTAASGARLSYPYLLPFSKPMRSLFHTDKRVENSLQLLEFNDGFVRAIETGLGRPLTIGDMLAAGYAVPGSTLKCLEGKLELPSPTTTLTDFIAHARDVVEQNAQVIMAELAADDTPSVEETIGAAVVQDTTVIT